jgi:hypothetical protein
MSNVITAVYTNGVFRFQNKGAGGKRRSTVAASFGGRQVE